MAAEPGVTTATFLVAGALVRFGRSKGWRDDEFAVYYRPDSDEEGMYLLLVADGFNDLDDYECTREVWRFLEEEFHAEPGILKSLVLVVRSAKKVAEGGLYAIGSGYRRLWVTAPSPTVSTDRGHEA